MKTCPHCGSEVIDNAKFCNNCGSEINPDEINNKNSQNTCPNCGHEVGTGMKFCESCGTKIIPDHDDINKTKFCSNCGTELRSDAKYCPNCGISPTEKPNYGQTQSIVKSDKNPLLAAILSFLLPGLGQAYLGLMKKGIILFVLAIIGGFLMSIAIGYLIYLIAWGYAMYDGYNSAEKMNNNVEVDDTIDLHNLF